MGSAGCHPAASIAAMMVSREPMKTRFTGSPGMPAPVYGSDGASFSPTGGAAAAAPFSLRRQNRGQGQVGGQPAIARMRPTMTLSLRHVTSVGRRGLRTECRSRDNLYRATVRAVGAIRIRTECTWPRRLSCRMHRRAPRAPHHRTVPRERLWALGRPRSTAAELLASCWGPARDGADVLSMSRRRCSRERGDRSAGWRRDRPRELQRHGGHRPTRRRGCVAALELGLRLAQRGRPPVARIATEDVALSPPGCGTCRWRSSTSRCSTPSTGAPGRDGHPRDPQLLPGASARGLPGGDRRGGGGYHPGPQPSERRPDPLRR